MESYTKLKIPKDWGSKGIDVIVSRVRIDWLPHHWIFILKCKRTGKSVVMSRESFGLDICLCQNFEQAKNYVSDYKIDDKSILF